MSENTIIGSVGDDNIVIDNKENEIIENTPAEVTGEDVPNPSKDEVTTPSKEIPADNDTLDFDKLIPSVPKTKEERGGLSRKEWKKQHEAQQPDEDEDFQEVEIDPELEERLLTKLEAKYADKFEALEKLSTHAETSMRRDLEQTFRDNLESKGISIQDFNSKYSEEFQKKRDEYIQAGMNQEKAVIAALDLTTAQYKHSQEISEVENRKDGRQRAKITPRATVSTEQPTYSQEELLNMNQPEYNYARMRIDSGQARLV